MPQEPDPRRDPNALVAPKAKSPAHYEALLDLRDAKDELRGHFSKWGCTGVADGAAAHWRADDKAVAARREHDSLIAAREAAREAVQAIDPKATAR